MAGLHAQSQVQNSLAASSKPTNIRGSEPDVGYTSTPECSDCG